METVEVLGMPPWAGLLVVGLTLAYMIGAAGFVLAKSGRSPLWSLVLLVPVANVVAIWAFAYARWPRFAPEDVEER